MFIKVSCWESYGCHPLEAIFCVCPTPDGCISVEEIDAFKPAEVCAF